MTSLKILFGHPTGAPHSHNAALAHFEAGRLEVFCVPWMPTALELKLIRRFAGFNNWSSRLERRVFSPLAKAPKIEGRLPEWIRMLKRIAFGDHVSSEALAYEANDWLMKTMARECRRPAVTAVHSYEDCSLDQFRVAKKLNKACIYDMPIGYYPAWEQTLERLTFEFAEWLPDGGLPSTRYVRPAQKAEEMELADLVFGPCTFVAQTIKDFTDKRFALAPYGVDSEFWHPAQRPGGERPLRFIYAGQSSIRKGIPLLLQAWQHASPKDAELFVVGTWRLSNKMRRDLPGTVTILPACSSTELRAHYRAADVFIFPSYFEGFGLVLLEAMACGLPIMATECTAAPDFLTSNAGMIVQSGDLDAWIEAIRFVGWNREMWFSMRETARKIAVENNWARYRLAVSAGVDQLFG